MGRSTDRDDLSASVVTTGTVGSWPAVTCSLQLVARLDALGRRAQPAVPPVLRHDDITLDSAQRRVTRDGRPVPLSNKEFGVLAALMAANGTILSAEELLRTVWDEHADPFTNAVRVTMSRLRAKLGEPSIIDTLPGVGYRMAGRAC